MLKSYMRTYIKRSAIIIKFEGNTYLSKHLLNIIFKTSYYLKILENYLLWQITPLIWIPNPSFKAKFCWL